MQTLTVPDPENPEDALTIQRNTDAEKTTQHLASLMTVRYESSRFLFSKTEPGTEVSIDQEAMEDARDTYLQAGVQIRNILNEQERLTLKGSETDETMKKLMAAQLGLSKDRQRMLEELKRPHVTSNAQLKLLKMTDGTQKWVCWAGGDDLPGVGDCAGVGNTPREATENFDKAFDKPTQNDEQK